MEKIRLGVNSRAEEEASIMPVSTVTPSSNVAPALGNITTNNNENLITAKFAPISSMPKWTDKSQKMLSVAVLLRSGMDDKRVSKVTVSARNNKLEVEMLWPSIMPDVEKSRSCWKQNKMSLSDTIMEIFNAFLRDSARRMRILFSPLGKLIFLFL